MNIQASKNRILQQKLASMSESERDKLASRGLIATVEGRTLSLHNTLIVYLQSNGNTPTIVGGYQQWKRAGKQVRKGERGFTIWFPIGNKDDNGDIIDATRFYTGTVFDISQVEVIQGTLVKPAQAIQKITFNDNYAKGKPDEYAKITRAIAKIEDEYKTGKRIAIDKPSNHPIITVPYKVVPLSKHGSETKTVFCDCLPGKDWVESHYQDDIPEPAMELTVSGKTTQINGNYKRGIIRQIIKV